MKTSPHLVMLAACVAAAAPAQDFNLDLLFDPLMPVPPPGSARALPNPNGPWNNDVIACRTGADGSVERLATFERAGVPTLARLQDGRLLVAHQHFPADDEAAFDKVAVRFSSDEGRIWTAPEVIRLHGLPEGMRFPFDPTLVPLPDGRVRLYFTSLHGRRFDEDLPRIYSAISNDGIDYAFEPGVRFSIEGRSVIDCAVVLHQGVFHLYSPDNGPQPLPGENPGLGPEMRPQDGVGYHAISTDGLTFTRSADVKIEGRRRWLGNAQSDGKQIIFFGTGESGRTPTDKDEGPGPRGGIFIATSEDGQIWQITGGVAIAGADPGAVAANDGGFIVVATGPPREGRRRQR